MTLAIQRHRRCCGTPMDQPHDATCPCAEFVDPEDLDVTQLAGEVWFWRIQAADELKDLLKRLTAARADNVNLPEVLERARTVAGLLSGAMSGDDVTKCPLCNQVLVPGEPALREVSEGYVHAHCMGELIEGDRYQCDPEGVVDENDDPIPGSDGVLKALPFSLHPDTDEIAGLVAAFFQFADASGARAAEA